MGEICVWAADWILWNLDEGSQCKLYISSDTISTGIFLPNTVDECDFSSITRLQVMQLCPY